MKTLLVLVLLVGTGSALASPIGQSAPKTATQKREPHPLAPSLPLLTEKENNALVEIVDRFILQDTGKLKGEAAAKAQEDFKALGPEATFALLAGLNKAANMEDSCPAVLIAKKLNLIISSTRDTELLDFLRESIGAGVTAKRHMIVLKDLKVNCTLRKAALARAPAAAPKVNTKEKPLPTLTVPELIAAANKAQGDALKNLLTELATRKGDPVVTFLGNAAAKGDKQIQTLAQGLLIENLSGQSANDLKHWLAKGTPPVKIAAATAIGAKGHLLTDVLIQALADPDEALQQAARKALVKLADNSVDYGPAPGAETRERAEAQEQWRAFWQKKP